MLANRHKQASVGLNKSTPSQDPLQRDIREWSNTFEKGRVTASPKVKVEVKARARENNQEKGTTTRTRLDLRMNMDSARWGDFGVKRRRVGLSVMSKRMMI